MRTELLASLGMVLLWGCSQGVSTPERLSNSAGASSAKAESFEINLPAQACDSGDPVYSLQNQSAAWTSYKTEERVPVVGQILAAGWVKTGAEGSFEIKFSPDSLNSQDELRDDRIKEYILGLGINDELSFSVTNVDEVASAIADGNGTVDINGSLTIYGQSIDVVVPTAIKTSGTKLTMKNSGLVAIDLMSTSFLVDQVIELLDIADVDEMQDTVEIDFSFEFKEECQD
ncbi:YceI family protein [Pseudobacteriovorax antillogorgiicola]|uniref:YceI-like domain-containing protein n=1 Tax=Pseudobacteriovorax antillogorgiicola TaxID=1513793 RepID=A0A1Y6CNX4_9BACT|nr:YceI family protein [Pseudobacteriovorax antillogorgiicola]TCS47001.1 YceI-like domain-containing protein [Pseudobacteriovorax antillogorgiicola]SMF64948.1 YceI-like domain-containing protein [Pseudobacteriovorax antillogorgiicola]